MSESTISEEEVEGTATWPDLAVGLYEELTGRGAEITYQFEEMTVDVPDKVGDDAEHARWRLDGTISITTSERD